MANEYRGIRTRYLPAPKSKHFETLIHSLLSVVDASARRFDIIHIHAIGSSVFSFLPRIAGIKTIVTVHGLDWQRPKWKGIAQSCLRFAEVASVKFPTQTTAVSRSVARYLEKQHGATVHAIPNGVNLHAPVNPLRIADLGLSAGRYVLFVGRLSEEKQCDQLLRAFEQVAPDGFQLAFAGGASYATSYERELRAEASGRVRFLGWVDQQLLAELYSNCAIFVLPSSMEGLSVALLEAMSYGAPVLVSDIPENLEVVGDCGATFHAGQISTLAQQLARLLANPASLRAMGAQGRRRVQDQFTWNATADSFERLYLSVVERNHD
jgi:glycosyltransferase involved in cell wall biosynthesis